MTGTVIKYLDEFADVIGRSVAHHASGALTKERVAEHFRAFLSERTGPLSFDDYRKWYDDALKNDAFKDFLGQSRVRRVLDAVAREQVNRQNFKIEFKRLLDAGGNIDNARIDALRAAYRLQNGDGAVVGARMEAAIRRGEVAAPPPAAVDAASTTGRNADTGADAASTTARNTDTGADAASTTARNTDTGADAASAAGRTAEDGTPLRTAARIPASLSDAIVPSFSGDLGNLMYLSFTQRFTRIVDEAAAEARAAGLNFNEQHEKYLEALAQQQGKFNAIITDMRAALGDGQTVDAAAFSRWLEDAAKKDDFREILSNPQIRGDMGRLFDVVSQTQTNRRNFIAAYNQRLATSTLGDLDRTFAGDLQRQFGLTDTDAVVIEARKIYDDVAQSAGVSASDASGRWASALRSADEAAEEGAEAAARNADEGGSGASAGARANVERPAGPNGNRVIAKAYEDWIHRWAGIIHPSHWGYAVFGKAWDNWGLGSLKYSLPSIGRYTMMHFVRPAINHIDGMLKRTGMMDEIINLQTEMNGIARKLGSADGGEVITADTAKRLIASTLDNFAARNSGKIDEAVTEINKLLDELGDGQSVLTAKYNRGLTGLTDRQAKNMREWLEDLRDTLQKVKPHRESVSNMARDFNEAIDKVAATAGANTEAVESLRSVVRGLDLNTTDSATLIKACEDEIARVATEHGSDTVGLQDLRNAVQKMRTDAARPSALARTYMDEVDRIVKFYGNDNRAAGEELGLILHSRFSRLGSDVKLRQDDVLLGLDGRPVVNNKGEAVGANIWRTRTLERQLISSSYNRQDRALKFLSSDLEHNLELRAWELLHYFERNAPKAVNVEPKNEFFAMVQSFYDSGLEHEALRIIRILKSKQGAAVRETIPRGFEGVVRDALRVESNPHRRKFYEDLIGAAQFELDTARKWGPREVERRFVAPLSEFFYIAEAFPMRGGRGSMGTGFSVPTVDNYLRYPVRNAFTEAWAYITGGATKRAPGFKEGEFVIDDGDKLRKRFDYTWLYRRAPSEDFVGNQGMWGRDRSLRGLLGEDGFFDRMPWYVKMPGRLLSGGMLSAQSRVGLSLPGKILAGGALATFGIEKGTAALGWNDGQGYSMPMASTVLATGASLRNPLLANRLFLTGLAGTFGLEGASQAIGLTDGGYIDPRGAINFLQARGMSFYDFWWDSVPSTLSGNRFTGVDLDTGRVGPLFSQQGPYLRTPDINVRDWILSWTDRGPEMRERYQRLAVEAEGFSKNITDMAANIVNIGSATDVLMKTVRDEATAARGRGEADKARKLEELYQRLQADERVVQAGVAALPALQRSTQEAFEQFRNSNGDIVEAEEALAELREISTELTRVHTEVAARQSNMRTQIGAVPEATSILTTVPTAPVVAVTPPPSAPAPAAPAAPSAAAPAAPAPAAPASPAPAAPASPAPAAPASPAAPAASGPAYIGPPSTSTTTGTPEQQLAAIKAEGDRALRGIRDDINNTSQQAQYANDTVRQILELQEQARNNNGNPAYFDPVLNEARIRAQAANVELQRAQEAGRLAEPGLQVIQSATITNLEAARGKLAEVQAQARAAREAQQKASRSASELRRIVESNQQLAQMLQDRVQRQRLDSITGAIEGGNNGPLSNLLRDRGGPGGQSYMGQMFNAVGNAFSGVRDWWTKDVARYASRSEGGKMLYQGANIGLGAIAALLGVGLWNGTIGEWTGTKISGGMKLLVVGAVLLYMFRNSSALGDRLDQMGGRYTATGNDYNMGSGATGPSPFAASTAPVTGVDGSVSQRSFLGLDSRGRVVGHDQDTVFRPSPDGRPRVDAAATMGEMSHVPSEAANVYGRAHNVRSDDSGASRASVYDFIPGGQDTALAYAH